MEQILHWDYQAFEWINQTMQSDWLDTLMPLWRTKTSWIPLYLLVAVWAIMRYRWPAWILIAGAALTIGISDVVSSRVIKPSVERPRPCRNEHVQARALVHCGQGFSFTSSHATNHFAIAIYLSLTLFIRRRWVMGAWLLWAAIVAYAQVYVGVHFPLDVISGGILGVILGYSVVYVMRQVMPIRFRPWDKQVSFT